MKRSVPAAAAFMRAFLSPRPPSSLASPHSRSYPAVPKRFYRHVDVINSGGNSYEIVLDSNKLKTPLGNILQISNEPLALAVAAEWDSQETKIERSTMHLTSLCNTVQDNPSKMDKNDLVYNILNFLHTDTILYHCQEPEELSRLQASEWGPVIEWFNRKYNVNISAVNDILFTFENDNDKETLKRHLHSYCYPSLQGFSFAVESLKSLILTLGCVEQEISIEKAISLSRLEEEYQVEKWGRVEWAHDLQLADLQSRVSAAVLFIRLQTEYSKIRSKKN